MKKLRLKKWAEKILIAINIIVLILMAFDFQNIGLFIISKVILITIFITNNILLYKYSNLFVEE